VFDRHDLWEVLNQQIAEGKVRHLGVSLGGTDVDHALRATDVGVSVVQVGYNRLDRTAEQACFRAVLTRTWVMAREPLANGYLSGKYRPGAWVTASNDWRSGNDPPQARRKPELVDEIRRTEVPEGLAMAPWASAGACSIRRQLCGRRVQVGRAAGGKRRGSQSWPRRSPLARSRVNLPPIGFRPICGAVEGGESAAAIGAVP
jgi:Aldo/keto reductase family